MNEIAMFAPFIDKMLGAGLPELEIANFGRNYGQLIHGATGTIPSSQAGPVDHVQEYLELQPEMDCQGEHALSRTVVCKLNGGLGTSMGLEGPKSLLPVKDGLTFLDITVRQVLSMQQRYQTRLPLILMDSFTTREASLQALDAYPQLQQDLPFDFLQSKAPKVLKQDLSPVEWPDDRDKEWCPPGHGDIYPTLITTGLLDQMLNLGYETLFVSNADNLGAVLDLRILGYFVSSGIPFLMEVARRTPVDSKGGHLARRPDGQLILRESAQCPPDETDLCQDIHRYKYFNTNNLWIHLPSLREALRHTHGVLDLPLIRNEKPVDPTQPDSPRVYQLETAMGSAISVFAGAQALQVPRNRFAPVKKNGDLLVVWSDAYVLTEDYHLELAQKRGGRPPFVTLDERYYGLLADMQARFPYGAPSLIGCDELVVQGDVHFGKDVVVTGSVRLKVADGDVREIPDGEWLQGID
jgi:UTP--glucose-1-phosphate uridylyltransferase